MCYSVWMRTIGLRELRQQASEFVRLAEAGEQVTVTVAGRPAARLVSVAPRAWRSWEETAELFAGPTDHDWDRDRDLIGQQLEDPWPAA